MVLLKAQGAKVEAPNKYGVTPLIMAAQNGHIEVVRFLEAQGAKVDTPANDGCTPLYFAAQNGHLEVVRFLVDRKVRGASAAIWVLKTLKNDVRTR